ncbi:MAG: GNVR domain-containing protein [Bryobacterales bacterium]|nr:GNVR domain-containing protein [Bryobacterales bacterium]
MIEQLPPSGFGNVSGTPDSYNIARRPLDIADYLDIARRHFNWVLAPAFAALVVAVIVAFLWPDTYVSEASMRITPPQVPQNLIPTGATSQMVGRINAIQQEVLSRDGLMEIIRSLNLYPNEVKKKPMEDVVEEMRKAIRINQIRIAGASPNDDSVAFQIRYSYEDKYTAQKVVREVVDKFIRLTNQGQFDRSSSTTQFLDDQVNDAKKELDGIEEALTQFRLANQGRLPDQISSNLAQQRAYQTSLEAMSDRLSRYGTEKLYLESQLAVLKDQARRGGSSESSMKTRAKSERLMQTERELLQMEAGLSALLQRYTDSHPDVRRLKSQLAVLEQTRNQLLKEETAAESEQASEKPSDKPAPRMDAAAERQIAEMEARIRLIGVAVEKDLAQQAKLQDLVASYSRRIESSPLMEQEYVRLTRDYDLAKSRYDDLNKRRTMSEMQTNLENRKQSELLVMLDQPSLPQKPSDPNRLIIIGSGLALGIFLGICVAGARELKDASLKNLKDVRLYSNLPVLGSVPLLENDAIVRRKRRIVFLAWATAILLGVGAMSASMYYYYFLLRR